MPTPKSRLLAAIMATKLGLMAFSLLLSGVSARWTLAS
jgi:hypothetical protein